MFKQKTPDNSHADSHSGSNRSMQLAQAAHQRYLLHSSSEDLTTAINFYIEALKDNPDTSNAYFRLASLLHDNGQIGIESAIEQCRRAVDIDPKNPNAHMYLGYFLSLKNEFDEASEHFKTAIKLKPLASSRTRLVLALTLLEKIKIKDKSLLDFSSAMYYIFSGSLLFLFDKASIKMFVKNIADDLSFIKYRAFGEILEKTHNEVSAYDMYASALDKTKNKAVFYEKMAQIAKKKKRFEVALECYQNAVALSNANPMCVVSAIEFIEEYFPEKTDELIDLYTVLTAQNPDIPRCYYELGHLYLKKEDKISAVNAFKLALDYEKDNPFYLNSLAFAYVQLEQYDSAIELYQKAINLNPDNEWSAVVAQALAAIYHQVKGNFDAAISMLQNALLLTKNKAPIYQAIADVYYDMEDLDKAIEFYNYSLDGDCDNPKAYSRLAMAYWEKDYIEKAIIYYSKAIDLDPEYDIAYNNLGVIFLDGLGDAKRALAYFENAVDINPNYVLAHFNIGRAYALMEQKIDAAKEYQIALNLNKINPEIESQMIEDMLYKLFEA